MRTFFVLWAIAFVILILVSIWTWRPFASLLRNPCRRQVVKTLLVELAAIPVVAFVLFYTTGGGFGPGTLIFFGIIITATFSLLYVAFQLPSKLFRPLLRSQGISTSEIPRLFVLGIMLPAFLLTPIYIQIQIDNACDSIDRQGGERIGQALDAYKADLGGYPTQVASLVPSYIDSIPYNACELPIDVVNRVLAQSDLSYLRYILRDCSDGESVLTVWTIGGGWGQSYDLQNGKWKYYDFSESECTHP